MWSYTYYFLNYEKFFAEAPLAEAPLAILEITYFFKSLTGAPLSQAPLSQAPLAQAPLSQAPLAIFRSSYVFGWGSFGRGSFGQAPLTRLLWHRLLQLPVVSLILFQNIPNVDIGDNNFIFDLITTLRDLNSTTFFVEKSWGDESNIFFCWNSNKCPKHQIYHWMLKHLDVRRVII